MLLDRPVTYPHGTLPQRPGLFFDAALEINQGENGFLYHPDIRPGNMKIAIYLIGSVSTTPIRILAQSGGATLIFGTLILSAKIKDMVFLAERTATR